MSYAWTYSHPGATFADQLLKDGRPAGKVCRHQRSLPLAEQRPGEPWKISEPFYVGFIGTDRLPDEHATLKEAHRAVERASDA